MKRRSKEIPACVLLLAASVAISGCEERRDCVDGSGHKQPDAACGSGHGGGGSHFVYGGSGGTRTGDSISGGSETSSASRGGFGGEGGGEGGGGE